MIEVENLAVDFDNKRIGPFNITINNKETIAIIGRSGSGKSTFINLLTNMIEPCVGKVTFDGNGLQKNDYTYINQSGTLFNHLTIKDNLSLTCSIDIDELKETFNKLDLSEDYIYKYPFELSGGERQRVDIARALLKKSKIIILDEAFSALDIGTKDKIYELIALLREEKDLIIIVITHDLNEAVMLGDRILIFDDGKIIFDDGYDKLIELDTAQTGNLISPKRMKLLRSVNK